MGGRDGLPAVQARITSVDDTNVHGESHVIPSSGVLIGRKEKCGIRLTFPTVSGEQCHIRRSKEDCFEVEDRSGNGTFVNEKLVGKGCTAPLASGDIIQLTKGGVRLLRYKFELLPIFPRTSGHVVDVKSLRRQPVCAQKTVGRTEQSLLSKRGEEELAIGDPPSNVVAAVDVVAHAAEWSAMEDSKQLGLQACHHSETADLNQQQAERDQFVSLLAEARAIRQEEQDKCGKLRKELNCILDKIACQARDIDALSIGIREAQVATCDVVDQLIHMKACTTFLEASLNEQSNDSFALQTNQQKLAKDSSVIRVRACHHSETVDLNHQKTEREQFVSLIEEAQTTRQEEQDKRDKLLKELNCTLEKIACQAGEIDALNIGIREAQVAVRDVGEQLIQLKAGTARLETRLNDQHTENFALQIKQQKFAQRIREKDSSIVHIQQLGQSMAKMWRCCASHLSETVNLPPGVLGTSGAVVTACEPSCAVAEHKQSGICNMVNVDTTLVVGDSGICDMVNVDTTFVVGDSSATMPVTPVYLQLQRAIGDSSTSSPRKRGRGECGRNIEVF